MDKEFEYITKALSKIKLEENEKQKMRASVLGGVDFSENVTNQKESRLYSYYQNFKEIFYMNNKNKFAPSLIIALVVLIAGGTSVFAEKTVPGDALYPLKVKFNEPVAGVFAFSKEEKAEWKERLVERRLEEAQKLVSKDNLDEATRLALEAKIESQIDDFRESAGELAERNNQSIESSDITLRLRASLKAYTNVMEKISSEEDENISMATKREAKKFLKVIEESSDKVKHDHDDSILNLNVAKQGNNSSKDASNLAVADSLLNSTKLSYQKEKINLSANIQNQINAKLASAETAFSEGKTLLLGSDVAGAVVKFNFVISYANDAKLLILSNVIKSNINDDMGIDDDEDIDEEEFGEHEIDHKDEEDFEDENDEGEKDDEEEDDRSQSRKFEL